jgi:hypothetical protein
LRYTASNSPVQWQVRQVSDWLVLPRLSGIAAGFYCDRPPRIISRMPEPPFALPQNVIDWIRDVFATVNRRTSAKLSRLGNVWETSLDMTVIEQLSQFSAPFKFPSDWIVHLDTHYLGGGRYWGEWEIADLGVLVVFRLRRKVLATKVALLQSKRLYPEEIEAKLEDLRPDYETGFGRLLESDSEYRSVVKPRTFHFTTNSRFRALEYKGKQYEAILKYVKETGIAVHYLLYNPVVLPWSLTLPVTGTSPSEEVLASIGCRVVGAGTMDVKLKVASLAKSENPSFSHVAGTNQSELDNSLWRLERFIADLVLGCKEGYLAGTNPFKDEGLFRVFNRRSGPISAAISITIDAPGQ